MVVQGFPVSGHNTFRAWEGRGVWGEGHSEFSVFVATCWASAVAVACYGYGPPRGKESSEFVTRTRADLPKGSTPCSASKG